VHPNHELVGAGAAHGSRTLQLRACSCLVYDEPLLRTALGS
jgi:hypothetical protein